MNKPCITFIEIKETMARFSADFKERFFGSVRSTWSTVQNFTSFRSSAVPQTEDGVAEAMVIPSS